MAIVRAADARQVEWSASGGASERQIYQVATLQNGAQAGRHLARVTAAHGLAGKIVLADAGNQARIVERQDIGPQHVEDQKHVGGPAADAANRNQFGCDRIVLHRAPLLGPQRARAEFERQINQVFDFALAQTRSTHVVDLQQQHRLGCDAVRWNQQQREALPNRLGCFERDLLADDAARQSRERVPARLQKQTIELRNQPLHHPITRLQVLAGISPINRLHGRIQRRCEVGHQLRVDHRCGFHGTPFAARSINTFKRSPPTAYRRPNPSV